MNTDELKQQYLMQVREKAVDKKEIIIYGAGTCGRLLAGFLRENGVSISGFCVTNINRNLTEIKGLPVLEWSDVKENIDFSLILLGIKTDTAAYKAIQMTLMQAGVKDYVSLPNGFFEKVLNDDVFNRPLIQVTPKLGCSVNCHFCPQDVFTRAFSAGDRKTMMSLQEFKCCIDKTPANTIIEFAGFVEPFLNPEAADMILYVAETGREVSLFSTLVGMDEGIWNKIKDVPFRKVVLHLPDEKQYANIPMTDDYFDLLKKMVAYKKVDGSNFIDLVNSQADIHPKVMEIISGKVLVWGGDLIDRAGNLEVEGARSAMVEEEPIYCKTAAHVNHNILLPDGSLVLCCMDMGMKHVIGNLLEESYADIMQGKVISEIRKKMAEGDLNNLLCKTCTNAVPVRQREEL